MLKRWKEYFEKLMNEENNRASRTEEADSSSHKKTSRRDGSRRDENVEVCYGSDEKRQD